MVRPVTILAASNWSCLNRSNLEKLYLVYIRPLFEYACEIWDNCGIGYSDKLEKLQLDAARIVTDYSFYLINTLTRISEWCVVSK
jgi:hypothetical protein